MKKTLKAESLKLKACLGFTLIELIISLAIIVILVAAMILVINPALQLAKSRNREREAHVNIILNAAGQNIFDNIGRFSCSSGGIPTTTKRMATSTGNYNIGPCLVPAYLATLPVDPSTSGAKYLGISDYDTGYFIVQNATTGRVTVSAPAAELGESISVTR